MNIPYDKNLVEDFVLLFYILIMSRGVGALPYSKVAI